MALDDFSKGYYEKRRAMMGRAPVQDSGDVMRKVNKQVYQAERSRPVLEQAAAEMQTEGRERSIGERIGKTVSGAAKSYLSSLTNAGGDAARTQGGLWRDFTRDSVREWQQEIDRWERDLSAWRADGSLTREEEEDLTGMIQANREKIATYTMAQEGRRGSAEAARGLADQIALSGARDTDQAKEGIGAAGQFAVDSGTGLVHLAGDIGLGAMTGGAAAIPLAVRSYGGSSQKARLEGANDDRAALYGLTSAAMEVATGMLGNVGRINSKFFGGGAVDDVVEGMVRALERKGGGKLSRALLNRAGTAAAGFVTEGAEEALSAIIDPFLRRAIYSDDPLDAGEILGDALYDFAVGGAVGGIAGGIGGTDTTRGLRSAERNADAAIDRAYDAMGSAGPWSPAAAEAVREANGLLEQAAWAAAETDGISGKAADRILRDESALEQLRQQTGLELSNDMTQSERRAAVKQAANWLAVLQKEQGQAGVRAVEGKRESVREERRADGDIGPYGTENRTAGGEKQTAAKRVYDAKRVLDGARAFGESGAKALAAAYDGRTDAESYYGGFAAYYQAGISNMDMRKVRSEYGAQLSEAQKYAAYVAGQNDAILSIQRERQAAPYAKSAGSDSGLVYDDFVRQAVESGRAIEDVNGETRSYLTAETAAKINSVAKSLGVRVQFVDSVRGGTANAQISGSTVLVERNNPNPVMAVVGHEMTHRMQELAPAEYREFRDIIAQEEQSSIQRRVDAYAAQGVALTYEQAMDEVAADYAGRMIDDGKVLDRFIEAHKENRTLLEKVRDAIQAIVRKLTGAEKKQAQTAEGKLTAALEAAAKRTETLQGESADGTMNTTRNSLKEDGRNERGKAGSGGPQKGSGREFGQTFNGERNKGTRSVLGELSAASGRYGGVNPSFGQTPIRSWAEGHTVEPPEGSVAYAEQQTAVDYGVPSFVVSDMVWSENKGRTPAFAAGGQIYFREILPEENRGMFAPHEITHVMRQVGYKPYLEFVERTSEMLNMSDPLTRQLLDHTAKHQGVDGTDADPTRLYDELNATIYGHYAANKMEGLHASLHQVFYDFDAYISELDELHERFKADNQRKTRFSLKSPVEETWIRQAKTLQAGVDGDTMGATRNSLKDLTEGERSALLQYKSSESYKINAKLRDGISLTEAEQKMVDELDHALEKLPRVEGTVYRTLNFDDVFAPQEEYEAFIVQHAEGVFTRYKAYTSVSTKTDGYPLADGTQYGVTLEIASRNARDLAGLGNNFESEALFPRRSVFDITRVTTDKNGHTRIYMEEVQINGGDQHQGHDTQKRGVAVRDLQEAHSAHTDLYGVSEADTGGNYGRRENLQGEGEEVERYSLKAGTENKSAAALQEENELLRERVEYWKGQTRRTKRVTTDKKAVQKAARELIRSYGADLDAGDITQDIQSLYDYVASGYDGKDELTYTEARRRAEAIAEKLVGNAVAVDETYEQYSDLRAYLRSTTLSLSEEDSRDIPDYGDWRKHQMGRMVIRKGHTNIDQVYQEMSEMWPEFFDEQRENNPVDQLLRIAEVMDGIYNVEEYNPFDPYMQQAITGAANEIMERFFDLPQTRATFADRQARKLDDAKAKGRERVQKVREQNAARLAELRRQNRERTEKAVERERTRRAEQIGKLKQRYREKDAAGRERRSARELRAKIMRHASALSQKLLRPSDKQHIPENLRQAVAAILESINLESAYTTDPNTGKRVKDGPGTPTKRTEAFRALRLAYAEIAKDGGDCTLIIDPDLMDNLNELESMKNTPIADMGMDQLTTVWATLKAVEASIRTANKMLGASRFETISGFADGIRSDNILRQDRGDYRGIAGKVDRLVNLDMLTPQGYFHRLGKTGEELFRMMRAAQDRHITIMQQAQDKTAEIIGKTDVNKLEREKHTFELSGGKVTMSTAQIMGLYELMKRKQAQDHILKGGIRPDTISSGRGLREDRRSDPVKVSMDDLATITGTLTEEQIRIADGLQKFMGGKLAELGNEASMAVYGYRKFTEKDYYPIKVDKNQTKRDISKEAQAATIAGRGFTKSVTPKANNAVMLESIFDTYSSHVNDMATYAAWLPTMENIRRIRDFTFRDGEGNRTGDVKSIIERVFGKNGNAYLNKLVDDINQGVRPNGTGNFTDALVGNYKAAAVAANIRVVLQQPTAILRAMSSLDPKYLLAGTVKRGDWAKVKKYAPIAVWKDWGYFDINTGRQMKDVLLSSDSVMEKVKQAAMAGAGKADSFAWARLWNAVEAETRDKRPGLKPGTEAFYQAVSTRFSEVVDQTQVVDGLLQRSQIMRSPDALTKMATSFMAEPTKTYNMFVNAVYDLRHATGKDGRSNAKRALARTSAALVVSFAVNAVMQSIVDALRDDDKERDYWEKFLTAYTGFTGEEETALDYWNSFWDGNLEANFNPAGYIPYFKDLVSIMQGYDVSRMDMEPVSKVLEAAANMKKALSGEGKYSVAGASANLLAEVSRLLGIPVANLKRDIQAGITTAAIETDNYLMQYRIDKALLNMGYQGNTKNFYDILYNASINDREAYETIYADMVASGMPEDKIRNAMESRMKRDQGVESVGDLEQRYLSPSQERRYNSTRNSMAGSSVWTAASRDQQEAAEKDLYDLTVGNDSGEKLQEKIAAGAAYGISEADYLLYRLALHVADQPTENGNLGSYTGEEVQTAIDMLPGLDDEARAYLWEAAGKSEKSNPYK